MIGSSLKISAVLITKNSMHSIAKCLNGVSFLDEIIVVDSGSEDGTFEYAQNFGARVFRHQWLGFGPQKNYAVSLASHDIVFCIDSDEVVTEELRQSILSLTTFDGSGYWITRRNLFLGSWLSHGEAYPDRLIRLFDRRKAQWDASEVHEKVVEVDGRQISKVLNGDLLHFSADSIESYLNKQERYATIQAKNLYENGARIGLVRLLVSPLFRFIKMYFFKRGFLDGAPGLIHIAIGSYATFIKYAKLYEYQLNDENK